MEPSSIFRDLPENVVSTLSEITDISRTVLGEDLISIILYGSAAEGRLRATSDINILFILSDFKRERVDPLRENLRIAQTSVRLSVMFLMESEIVPAAESFSVKFSDIIHRHRILYGKDCLSGIAISREARIGTVRQILFNLALRLRESYVMKGLREEQLSRIVADAAPPLRSSAMLILELEGETPSSPKEALETICRGRWKDALQNLSTVREGRILPPGVSGETLFKVMEMCSHLRERAGRLS